MNNPKNYPLSWPIGWPRTTVTKASRFGRGIYHRPTISAACTELEDQLRILLGVGSEYILSTNLKPKNDGLPYSDQSQPSDKGSAVYFRQKGKDVVIACDKFDRVACNITAIAKTIEALRGIDRWGCSELMDRAFTGFQALPEKASAPSWWSVLELPVNAGPDQVKERYRQLVKKYHPDNHQTGDSEKFMQVKAAYQDAVKQFQPAHA